MANQQENPKTILVVITRTGSYENELLLGISQYIQPTGRFCMRIAKPEAILNAKTVPACDGIITKSGDRAVNDILKAKGVPVVDIACEYEDSGLVGVDSDAEKIGTMAAEWFMRRGFRSFAHCGLHGQMFSDIQERAFVDAVRKAGFGCITFDNDEMLKKTTLTDEITSLGPKSLWGLEAWVPTLPPRTAVLCQSDFRALRFLQFCMRHGRAVPDDIAVMGVCNDVALCCNALVPLSSVDPNARGVGYAAMRLMGELLKRPFASTARPIFRAKPNAIVERESTAVWPVNPPWLAKALRLLDDEKEGSFSTAALAEAAGMSQSSLQAAFHKAFGTSAGKYLMAARMRKAKQLVDDGTISLKEIAARCGFSAQSHFCRAYRTHFGHAPSHDLKNRGASMFS